MSNQQQTPPPPPPDWNPPQGQTYGAIPGQEPRKKSWFARHKILTGIIAVMVLFVVFGALSGGDDESPSAATPTSAESESSAEEGTGSSAGSQGSTADESDAEEEVAVEEAVAQEEAEDEAEEPAEEEAGVARVGDTVPVGEFSVTVTGVEGGIASVGDQYFGEEAQGQFVKVLVTVENTGNSAEFFLDSEQKLIDDQDRQHSTSSSSYLLDEQSLFLAEINPGNKVEGVLLYDIPADATPTALDLQSGLFGKTVRVALGG